MKFYVETKKNGEKIKKKIKRWCDKWPYITQADVIGMFGHTPAEEAFDIGWASEDVKKKMRLRETKGGWFLYIPGEVDLSGKEQMPKEDNVTLTDEDIWRIVDQTMRMVIGTHAGLPCKVISKPTKNSVREEEGLSLGVFQLNFTKADDEVVAFPVFVVVMKNDGSVRQVKPENIIFELEGDE